MGYAIFGRDVSAIDAGISNAPKREGGHEETTTVERRSYPLRNKAEQAIAMVRESVRFVFLRKVLGRNKESADERSAFRCGLILRLG
jgi:hypothetical protein